MYSSFEQFESDLDIEVQGQINSLRNSAEALAVSLRGAMKRNLLKIPKKIRNMTIREFKESYNSKVENVLGEKAQKRQLELETWVQNTPRLMTPRHRAKMTPLISNDGIYNGRRVRPSTRLQTLRIMNNPSIKNSTITSSRAVRASTRTNTILSQLNSIEHSNSKRLDSIAPSFATPIAKKKLKPPPSNTHIKTSHFTVTLSNGNIIDLTKENNFSDLNDGDKRLVKRKMVEMQSQLMSMLSTID